MNLPASIDRKWWIAGGLALGYVWLRTIDHLRVEWTVNESYSYGWAVPVLCLVLLHRRWNQLPANARGPVPGRSFDAMILAALLAIVFAFTRWIGVANPDWRLISWALALEAIGLSLLFIHAVLGNVVRGHVTFPILFFLVAVPWPSSLENSIVRWLTHGIVATTAETLNALGHVAIRHGNVIETAGGLVDVDRACSGIRSLQSALMLALFFGEWRRLPWSRRTFLCGGAVALACLFNWGRTFVLSLVTTYQGSEAVADWHDPLSLVILVGCFVGVWAAAHWLDRPPPVPNALDSRSDKFISASLPALQQLSIVVLSIILCGELAVGFWYRTGRSEPVTAWTVQLPRSHPEFRDLELPPAALQILRFNESKSGKWRNTDGTIWQLIFLQWHPGRAAVTLARNHTPEICLPAAGKNLRATFDIDPIEVHGLRLPFRCFETDQGGRPLFVFYTLWEDDLEEQHTRSELMTWQARWDAVLNHRRNPGQRVLQLGLVGAVNRAHAEQLLRAELPRLIHVSLN